MSDLVSELHLDDVKWLCKYCMEDNEHVSSDCGSGGLACVSCKKEAVCNSIQCFGCKDVRNRNHDGMGLNEWMSPCAVRVPAIVTFVCDCCFPDGSGCTRDVRVSGGVRTCFSSCQWYGSAPSARWWTLTSCWVAACSTATAVVRPHCVHHVGGSGYFGGLYP